MQRTLHTVGISNPFLFEISITGPQFHTLRMCTAQAVSSRIPTAVVGIGTQIRSFMYRSGKSGIEEGFLRVLRFPLSILIPSTDPYCHVFLLTWLIIVGSGLDESIY
jgi:hypothetical protein